MKRSRARDPEAIEFARDQRATANEFARTVWQWVRESASLPPEVSPRDPIPPYTVDFCCVELKFVLEVDGSEHFTEEGKARDQIRG